MGLHHIIIALGTNTQPEAAMREARGWLSGLFPGIRFSSAVWTEPIGMEGGAPFRNCLAYATTPMALRDVEARLKEVEALCGRTKGESLRHVIRMDADLLLYDHQRRHDADWERPYIRQLMREMGGHD